MDNIYRIAAATARSNSTPLPIAQPPTRRRPPQQPLKPPTDRHARQSALPESIRRPSHRQPTATHRPPCTREYPPPQSLVNSRHHSSNAHASAPVPTRPSHPENPQESCKSCFRQSPQRRQTLVISRQTLTRAPLRQRRPSHPENPQKIMQILLQTIPPISRKLSYLSSNAHTSAPAPAAPLPSRKSPKNHANPASDNPPISRNLS